MKLLVVILLGLVALASTHSEAEEREEFKEMDKNGDGSIELAEAIEWGKEDFSKKENEILGNKKEAFITESFEAEDDNGDGKLTFKEFIHNDDKKLEAIEKKYGIYGLDHDHEHEE